MLPNWSYQSMRQHFTPAAAVITHVWAQPTETAVTGPPVTAIAVGCIATIGSAVIVPSICVVSLYWLAPQQRRLPFCTAQVWSSPAEKLVMVPSPETAWGR